MNLDIEATPSRPGDIAIVTGANTGLGFETTRYFALKGIRVVMACRTVERGEGAADRIRQEISGADLDVMALDLSQLQSVRTFADAFRAKYERLDLLVNNAGIMATPYQRTVDGFEGQLAANYIGHFLLTNLLLDMMPDSPRSRVVVLSSIAHAQGLRRIRFEDIHWQQGYDPGAAYAQTNLARLLFMRSLRARLKQAGSKVIAVAAHPGVSDTELTRAMPPWQTTMMRLASNPFLTHPPRRAARPQVAAALSAELDDCEYFGPQGFFEMAGPPGPARIQPWARDEAAGERLWALTEQMTGQGFGLADKAAAAISPS